MEKLIHRFWAGPRDLPEEYVRFGQKWQLLNKDWRVIDWTEEAVSDVHEDLPEVGKVIDHLYERDNGRNGIELFVQIADVMGYYFVWKHGGAYFNMDMEPVRPLPTALMRKAWASYENEEDWRIVNAAIGSPGPRNIFWDTLLDELPRNYWKRPTDEMVMSTGPGFLTDFAQYYRDMLFVFPKQTFNPVHWKEIDPGGDATGMYYPHDTIAVHHWGHKKLNSLGQIRSNVIETATRAD